MKKYNVIILIGRPASGKSEIINYLKNIDDKERLTKFGIGKLKIIDDFPMLWTWFEEDSIRENILHVERIHSTPDYRFLHQYQWNLLIERFNLEYQKLLVDNKNFFEDNTLIIEFSRGTEHGGYKEAFAHLSSDILAQATVFFVNVPFEESLRKNRRRFNPDKPHSILEHGLSDKDLERMYKIIDWEEVKYSLDVPIVTLENYPEMTDNDDNIERLLSNAIKE